MLVALMQTAAENAHPGGGIFFPTWVIGLFSFVIALLLGLIGWFARSILFDFKSALRELKDALREFEDKLTNNYVGKELFNFINEKTAKEITNAHSELRLFRAEVTAFRNDIASMRSEIMDKVEEKLYDHDDRCPYRGGAKPGA